MLFCEESEAEGILADLMARGYAKERTGRVPGVVLEPSGVDLLDKLLVDEGLRASDLLRDCYDRFAIVDPLIKKACEISQSEGFDAGLDALERAIDKARACVRRIVKCASRYGTYLARLDACMARLREGDSSAFTKHQAESFHQVWWELHTDLAVTLNVEKVV